VASTSNNNFIFNITGNLATDEHRDKHKIGDFGNFSIYRKEYISLVVSLRAPIPKEGQQVKFFGSFPISSFIKDFRKCMACQ
jgi:hypothetical protein